MFSPIFYSKANFFQARNFWWVRLNLIKFIYLKSTLKCDSFDVTSDIKIPFLEFQLLLSRVSPYYSSLPRTVWLALLLFLLSLHLAKFDFAQDPTLSLHDVVDLQFKLVGEYIIKLKIWNAPNMLESSRLKRMYFKSLLPLCHCSLALEVIL